MKTLAELKRDAKAGKISAILVERFGKTGLDIPEMLRGKRKVIDANSVGITFLNADGKKSELRIEAASLVEYTDKNIIVYNPGLRDLTPDEQAFLQKWEEEKKKTDYERRSEIDALSDGSSTYWQQKFFFEKGGYDYLFGTEKKQGKKFDYKTGKVWDNKVKGDVILKYELCS
jgi:hypothetical protein